MDWVPMTIGQAAKRLGVKDWQIRRLYKKGILPEPGRFSVYRVISEEELKLIEKALREAGYLPKVGAKAEA